MDEGRQEQLSVMKEELDDEISPRELALLVQLQALIRGWLVRRRQSGRVTRVIVEESGSDDLDEISLLPDEKDKVQKIPTAATSDLRRTKSLSSYYFLQEQQATISQRRAASFSVVPRHNKRSNSFFLSSKEFRNSIKNAASIFGADLWVADLEPEATQTDDEDEEEEEEDLMIIEEDHPVRKRPSARRIRESIKGAAMAFGVSAAVAMQELEAEAEISSDEESSSSEEEDDESESESSSEEIRDVSERSRDVSERSTGSGATTTTTAGWFRNFFSAAPAPSAPAAQQSMQQQSMTGGSYYPPVAPPPPPPPPPPPVSRLPSMPTGRATRAQSEGMPQRQRSPSIFGSLFGVVDSEASTSTRRRASTMTTTTTTWQRRVSHHHNNRHHHSPMIKQRNTIRASIRGSLSMFGATNLSEELGEAASSSSEEDSDEEESEDEDSDCDSEEEEGESGSDLSGINEGSEEEEDDDESSSEDESSEDEEVAQPPVPFFSSPINGGRRTLRSSLIGAAAFFGATNMEEEELNEEGPETSRNRRQFSIPLETLEEEDVHIPSSPKLPNVSSVTLFDLENDFSSDGEAGDEVPNQDDGAVASAELPAVEEDGAAANDDQAAQNDDITTAAVQADGEDASKDDDGASGALVVEADAETDSGAAKASSSTRDEETGVSGEDALTTDTDEDGDEASETSIDMEEEARDSCEADTPLRSSTSSKRTGSSAQRLRDSIQRTASFFGGKAGMEEELVGVTTPEDVEQESNGDDEEEDESSDSSYEEDEAEEGEDAFDDTTKKSPSFPSATGYSSYSYQQQNRRRQSTLSASIRDVFMGVTNIMVNDLAGEEAAADNLNAIARNHLRASGEFRDSWSGSNSSSSRRRNQQPLEQPLNKGSSSSTTLDRALEERAEIGETEETIKAASTIERAWRTYQAPRDRSAVVIQSVTRRRISDKVVQSIKNGELDLGDKRTADARLPYDEQGSTIPHQRYEYIARSPVVQKPRATLRSSIMNAAAFFGVNSNMAEELNDMAESSESQQEDESDYSEDAASSAPSSSSYASSDTEAYDDFEATPSMLPPLASSLSSPQPGARRRSTLGESIRDALFGMAHIVSDLAELADKEDEDNAKKELNSSIGEMISRNSLTREPLPAVMEEDPVLRAQLLARVWTDDELGAVVEIQRIWRGRSAIKRYKSVLGIIVQIQSGFRRRSAQRDFQKNRHAVIAIQALMHGALIRKVRREITAVRKPEATIYSAQLDDLEDIFGCQSHWRKRDIQHEAALTIQREFFRRRTIKRVVKVQKFLRGLFTRRSFYKARRAAIQIQAQVRGFETRLDTKGLIVGRSEETAVLSLEVDALEGFLGMESTWRRRDSAKKGAALKIQSAVRCFQAVRALSSQRDSMLKVPRQLEDTSEKLTILASESADITSSGEQSSCELHDDARESLDSPHSKSLSLPLAVPQGQQASNQNAIGGPLLRLSSKEGLSSFIDSSAKASDEAPNVDDATLETRSDSYCSDPSDGSAPKATTTMPEAPPQYQLSPRTLRAASLIQRSTRKALATAKRQRESLKMISKQAALRGRRRCAAINFQPALKRALDRSPYPTTPVAATTEALPVRLSE